MNSGYIIKWTSRLNGNCGKGTHAFASKCVIDKYIDELNKKYKDIHHEAISAPIGTPLLDMKCEF